jgi:hypothetical protein
VILARHHVAGQRRAVDVHLVSDDARAVARGDAPSQGAHLHLPLRRRGWDCCAGAVRDSDAVGPTRQDEAPEAAASGDGARRRTVRYGTRRWAVSWREASVRVTGARVHVGC